MISLKMKLAGAIIPLSNGAVGVTLVPSDNGEGGAKAVTMQVQILDADLASRLSLEDELTISIEPAGELRADAWAREQAEKNAAPAPAGEDAGDQPEDDGDDNGQTGDAA